MNMKNTVILLIFLLAVAGLIIGVYYTEEANFEKNPQKSSELLYEDSDGVITVSFEKNENDNRYLADFFT